MPTHVLDKLRGKFLVFDGVDGSGKGAQIRLLTEALAARGIEFVTARDPGGTTIGDRIRHVLLGYDLSNMDPRCEALLFMASRAQLAREVIDPALARGAACICDRYVSATCAYQGAAGYDPRRVIELARFAIDRTWPHLTLVIDLPPKTSLARTGRKPDAKRKRAKSRTRGQPTSVHDVHHREGRRSRDGTATRGQPTLFHDVHPDAMEVRPMEFHERVRQLFLELPTFYPAPVAVIDGSGTVQQVHGRILEAIAHAAL